jgi:hypothetical protein
MKLAETMQLSISKPIREQMDELSIIMYFLDNLLFTVIFFLCMLSFILIYSLIQSVRVVISISLCRMLKKGNMSLQSFELLVSRIATSS